jgi:hypothetical protein
LVLSVAKAASADRIYVFVADALAAASSQTVTFNCSQDNATGAVIQVCSVAGMTRTGQGAVRQTASTPNATAGGTPAATFSAAALTGNPTLGIVSNGASPAALTPPTNWTEGNDTGYSTPPTGAEYVFRDSGFTGTTITWGGTSATAYGVGIIELDTSTPAITGTSAATLADVTGAGTAQVLLQGTAGGGQLADVAGAGEAVLLVRGTGDGVLADVVGSGTALIEDSNISGAGSFVLADVVGAGEADVLLQGLGGGTLADVVGAGTAQVLLQALGGGILSDVVGAGFAVVVVEGSATSVLDAVLGSGAAAVLVEASAAAVLADVLGAGSAVIGTPPVIGQGGAVLDSVAGAGSAALMVRGDGDGLLQDVLGVGAAGVLLRAVAAGQLEDVVGAGTAVVVVPVVAGRAMSKVLVRGHIRATLIIRCCLTF